MTIKNLFDLLIRDYWENIQRLKSLSTLTGKSNWFKALIHFKKYAYERNISGAAFVYRRIADEVLGHLETRNRWRYDYDLEKKIWNDFKKKCKDDDVKPNKTVNPLKPSHGEKVSLVKFVWDIYDRDNNTVAAWAFRMLADNKIYEAHEKLKTVWGVGDKIASFYLRDIYWLGHHLKPPVGKYAEDDYLLQPVDIWVERAIKALENRQKSRTSMAKFMSSFEKENDIAHGGGNIAFWMLGSNYIDDPDNFCDVVKAIAHKSKNASTNAVVIASRFEHFLGTFGKILKNVVSS